MLGKSIGINSIVLGIFALVTAGALALIHATTADRIAEQEKRAAEKALLEIVPRTQHDNDMLTTLWTVPPESLPLLGLTAPADIHIATSDGKPVAVIIPSTAPDGYSGDIKLLVGIFANGDVAGVRVLSHKETPGLGDKVDLNKSDWVLGFNGLSLINPIIERWKVKKDGGSFDQFTGATITPRAVVKRVKHTLTFFENNKAEILASTTLEATNND